LNSRSSRDPAEFQFTCLSTEGAVLVLPNGASSEDLCYRQNLEAYIRRHAVNWYEHVYGPVGLEAAAGPLYLVTGHDKSNNWCLGSYSGAVSRTGMSLTFTPTDVAIGGTVLYSPHIAGNVDTRTHQPRGGNSTNQCVFIRGYKLTLCTSLMEKIFVGQVKVSDIVPPKSGNGDGFGGALGTTTLGRGVSWLVGGNGGRNQPQNDEPHNPTSDGTGIIVESFPDFPEVRHPGSTCLFQFQTFLPALSSFKYNQLSLAGKRLCFYVQS
jgi:hypothetical protein